MKKFIALLCIIAALFCLCACSDNTPVDSRESFDTDEKVVTEGKHFTVSKITGEDQIVKYRYKVTDKDGKVLEEALCAELPRVAQVNDSLIGIRFTANNHVFVRYFDVQKGLVSQSFKNAFWGNDTLVATNDYDNGHYFMVRDIFDDDGYSCKVEVDSDTWQIAVTDSQVNTNGTALIVKYVRGDGSASFSQTYTVTLPLE